MLRVDKETTNCEANHEIEEAIKYKIVILYIKNGLMGQCNRKNSQCGVIKKYTNKKSVITLKMFLVISFFKILRPKWNHPLHLRQQSMHTIL